jgi:uncharacterized repeat protein (TIGR02543 family)
MKKNEKNYAAGWKLAFALAAALALSACDLFSSSEEDEPYHYKAPPDPVKECTITFMSLGGSYVEPIDKVKEGSTITLPDPPLRGGYVFQGWYYDNKTFLIPFTSSTPVTLEYGTYGGSIRVYAKWSVDTAYTDGVLPDGSFNDKLRVIAERADKNVIYTIPLGEDTECEYWDIVTRGINVVIRITSANPRDLKKLSAGGTGALFSINNNITVKLENIIIQGKAGSENSAIIVNGGVLELLGGAKITGNHVDGSGAGVGVYANGSLILDGGEICGNTSASWGGGVLVNEKGQFTMKSGSIHHNTAGTADSTWSTAWGGGVGVYKGKFLMTGGEIYANTAVAGGGVGIYGTGYSFLSSQFVKKPPFASTDSGVIYGEDGPEDKRNIAAGVINTGAGSQCDAVAYHDGKPYGDISYRGNTIDNYTGITTDNLNAVWDERIREYNL